MHGEPAEPADMQHLRYADPAAVKGGTLRLAANGSFDNLNPFIITGVAAQGLRGYVFESLLERSTDEAFTLYGLIAETVETPADRSWVEFTINPKARFSDGKPVTVDDVVFSLELLRDHGRPNHRDYYSKVAAIERKGERGVRFTFAAGGDREIPLIIGLMPVLPKHIYKAETFETPSYALPVGSGPYVVSKVEPGKSLTYKANPDYWAKDLAVMRGRNNFAEIRYDYYQNVTSAFEAFKVGDVDLRTDADPNRWQSGYDFPAATDGRVVKAEIETGLPAGMSSLVFNTRRAPLTDIRVRTALTLMFDAEWINRQLYRGLYARNESFFERSVLSSSGRPADARELALLGDDVKAIDPSVLDGSFRQPQSDGSGFDRTNLRKALALLKEAGFALKDGVMTETGSGKPLMLSAIAVTEDDERLFVAYIESLKKAGIALDFRRLDSAAYQSRVTKFDFDIIPFSFVSSLSPGNEQRFRWLSTSADTEGSFNYAGVKNPAIDRMIDKLLAATTAEDFIAAVRALDRLLLSGRYVVPLFHNRKVWVAHWSKLRRPAQPPVTGLQLDTWWIE